jgi:5'-nucleotidase
MIYARGDLKVGVYALGPDLKGRVAEKRREELVFSPPSESALYWEKRLREDEGCDLVICLSQLGFDHSNNLRDSDLRLSSQLRYTDALIGGRSLRAPEEPVVAINAYEHRVILSYTDPYARNVGVVDFHYNRVEGVLKRPVRWTMKSV